MSTKNIAYETIVLDGRHVVEAWINYENRCVECTMFTSDFGPISFFSAMYSHPVDYLKEITNEARDFIPWFDELEKQNLNEKNAE